MKILILNGSPKGKDSITLHYAKFIQKKFPDLTIRDWKKIQPDLGMTSDMMGMMMYVIIVIILLALAFAIINTMLMVVLERTKELGMLMAIGMGKIRVFKMIMLSER